MTDENTNNFDALRILCALLVLISHQFALSGRPEPVWFGAKLGSIGVLIFFSISGYLVSISWRADPNLPRFLFRRFLRVWPAFAVCLTVCMAYVLLVILPKEQYGYIPDLLRAYCPNYLFIWRDGIFFPQNPYKYLNGSLWTIPLEVECYLLFAIMAFSTRKVFKAAVLSLAALIILLYLCYEGHVASGALPLLLQAPDNFNFPCFFIAGCLVANYMQLQKPISLIVLALLSAVALGCNKVGLMWVLIIPVMVIAVGNKSWPILRRFGRFGDFSYGLYLWAWPMEQIGVSLFGVNKPFPVLLLTTLIGTSILAFASWHVIEKRALRLKPRAPSQNR